ncbi:hypothetical protein AF46_01655 [Klebsiella pneumoniae MGH 60]|nr:hypothetical protein AF46_01655 [Klebsiella pneumoniae MGH 60]
MRVHFIVHESFEAPGAYETWAINQGHDVTYSRVYAGDRLPDDAVGIDFLIVMGGPQDPDTTLEECPHFNAKAEQALIALKWFTEFGHLNRGDMLTSEQHRCHNEKKKFQRRV